MILSICSLDLSPSLVIYHYYVNHSDPLLSQKWLFLSFFYRHCSYSYRLTWSTYSISAWRCILLENSWSSKMAVNHLLLTVTLILSLALILLSRSRRMGQIWKYWKKPRIVSLNMETLLNWRSWANQVGFFFVWHLDFLYWRLLLTAITTCEPENFKSILSLKFSDFKLRDIRKRAFHPLLGKGIFTTDGIEWEHSRAMLRPNFSRNRVADIEMYDKLVEELVNAIPVDGSTVDLQDLFFDLTVDSSTEFLFGESANVLSKRNKNLPGEFSFGDSFNHCTARLGKYIRVGLRPLVNTKEYCQAESNVHIFANRYVYKAIEEYRANQANPGKLKDDNRYIFLRELVKQTQDPQQLRSECLNILLAGRDTTASLMTILWNTLSKRPDVWTKLQQEVDQLDGVKPSYERIKSMKYLRFCIHEGKNLLFYLFIFFSLVFIPSHQKLQDKAPSKFWPWL